MVRIVKKKKKISFAIKSTDKPLKKKTMLGPQQQDRLKVKMNQYHFSCHNVHHLNSGEGKAQMIYEINTNY